MSALDVVGGAAGSAARLAELESMAGGLADRAADCAALAATAASTAAAVAATAVAAAAPLAGAGVASWPGPAEPAGAGGPWAVPSLLRSAGAGAGAGVHLVQAAGRLAGAAGAVLAAAAAYRAREEQLLALARAVPLGAAALLRGRAAVPPGPGALLLAPAAVLGAGAVGAAVLLGRGPDREAVGRAVAARPGAVDAAVRVLPGLLGVPGAPEAARLVTLVGRRSGVVRDGEVAVAPGPVAACGPAGDPSRSGVGGGRAAGGVADLLHRGQSVAAWRAPGPGEHDPLPAGAVRPGRGEVRVDRVRGADGAVAWVVHVPGTQEWDVDGEGSPMDLAANLALVGGTGTGVTRGVTEAVRRAGVRPGQPVLLVGHSQGGLTAAHLAADPAFRRHATVTHVVTAGSPLTAAPPPRGVQVLALEHTDDLVPRLDGRPHHGYRDRPDRTTVTARAPDGPWRAEAVPAHSSSAYVVTGRAVDASTAPSLVAYRRSLAPFLDRDGAVCTSSRYVLERVPSRAAGAG